MKTLKFLSIGLLLILFTVSCGKRGPQGPLGYPGAPGNANVVSGTITTDNWDDYYAPSWGLTINYSEITRDIIEYGAVLVYMQHGDTYRQLPLTFFNIIPDVSGDYYYSTSIEVSTFVGGVTIFWTDSDFWQPEHPGRKKFKIVVIASSEYRAYDIDYSDYNQVKEAFDLVD